jgi:hypothetical protein
MPMKPATIRTHARSPLRRAGLAAVAAWLGALGAGGALAQVGAGVPPAAGHLRADGGYPQVQEGATVSVLPGGGLFAYGSGLDPNEWRAHAEQRAELRARHGMKGTPDAGPKAWDPARHGWRRIAEAPECVHGTPYLHTATVLADGKVLIAGGLCDHAQMADDPSPQPPHTALSLWDPTAGRWLSAPSLAQARIGHTATLMPDGGVVIAGGELDPGGASGEGDPVLASVERFSPAGQVDPLPAMGVPRALHTATALADGRLLVAGGLDFEGHAIGSAEVFDPRAGTWRSTARLHLPRYGHTATLLADGRVLLAGGIGFDGHALASSELWDPATDRWEPGPELPLPLHGHGAARLASGDVLVAGGAFVANGGTVPWAWTWHPGDPRWRVAGRAMPDNETAMSTPVVVAPRPDGGARILARQAILRWEPGPTPYGEAPAWQARPVAATLADGRVMFIGRSAGGAPVARLWDPASDRWSEAGAPDPGTRSQESALVLPSGRVLRLGIDDRRTLHCDAWDPATNAWSDCGATPLEYASEWRLQPGLLTDGRAFVIANRHEVLVFDEQQATWRNWLSEWHEDSLNYGAPVQPRQPLGRIQDPVGGTWFAIDEAAGRFWQGTQPMLRAAWNPQRGWWDYILPRPSMGLDARRLPDGCWVSSRPLALYDPRDGLVRTLPDPGFGTNDTEMVALADGTVVAAGPGLGTLEPGSGFFHRKASCAGFELASADDTYVSPGYVADAPVTVRAASEAGTSASASAGPSSLRRLVDGAKANKWLLLAGFGPLLAWFLLRRLPMPGVRGGAWRWPLRIVVYGALLWVLLPWVRATLGWHAFAAETPAAMPKSTLPCRLVGVWSSTHGGVMRRIELQDDGRYAMSPSVLGNDPPGGYKGRWTVSGDRIIWRDDRMPFQLDTNQMLDQSDGRFTVIEGDRKPTRFERIRAVASTTCAP